MSENLKALGDLTADQQALLLLMLRKKAQARARQRIPRASRGPQQPLSFAQERLWFLNQFEPESAFYNIPIPLQLRGSLNVAALESTLNELLRRHEVLRTAFVENGGELGQQIRGDLKQDLPLVETSSSSRLRDWRAKKRAVRSIWTRRPCYVSICCA